MLIQLRSRYTAAILAIALFQSAHAMPIEELTEPQRKQLTIFGMRALGLNVNEHQVKVTPDAEGVRKMVAGGLNMNGHLCARPLDVTPLPKASRFEVTCIAVRGGQATKSYLIDCALGAADAL